MQTSGFEDGTGVTVSGSPSATVGRILHAENEELRRRDRSGCCGRWCNDWFCDWGGEWCAAAVCSKRKKWELVTICVVNPADTVKESKVAKDACNMASSVICVFAAALLLCLFLSDNIECFMCKCKALVLPHGTLHGDCIGEPGSVCLYSGCDTGYKLMPSTIDKYDGDASDEASAMVSEFPPCDSALSAAAALGTGGRYPATAQPAGDKTIIDGWTCYRQGQRPFVKDGRTDTDRWMDGAVSKYQPFPQRDPDGDLGWCVSDADPDPDLSRLPGARALKFCSLSPKVCTVCTHPGLDSGWKACELSAASDGSAAVCRQPTAQMRWSGEGNQVTIDFPMSEMTNPLLTSCWLPTQYEADHFGLPWPWHVQQSATDEHGDHVIPLDYKQYRWTTNNTSRLSSALYLIRIRKLGMGVTILSRESPRVCEYVTRRYRPAGTQREP